MPRRRIPAPARHRSAALLFLGGAIALFSPCAPAVDFEWQDAGPGLAMIRITNDVPVIYSAVRIERARFQNDFTLVTTLASNQVTGTETLPSQIAALPRELGTAVAAINADFFMMSGSAKGDPRGLHIWRGELVSVAAGPAAFWMDASGHLHGEPVRSRLTVTWPGAGTNLAGLNEQMDTNDLVLFTPRMGELYPPTNARSSTVTRSGGATRTSSVLGTNSSSRLATVTRTNAARTNFTARTNSAARFGPSSAANMVPRGGAIRPPGGREWILDYAGDGPWLPLRIRQTYHARAFSWSDGFTNVPDGKMILSLSSNAVRKLPPLKIGLPVSITVVTKPDLTGLEHALGTGPMLVRGGQLHEVTVRMSEQPHPRAAIGWNDQHLFFAVSDGRRKGISEGIRLAEMAEFMIALGCKEAINMDGGQSTTLMVNGQIINAQTPGGKHEVANGIVILRKPAMTELDADE